MNFIKRHSANLTKRFKASRFAQWYNRTFKDEFTTGEWCALVLLLMVLVIAAPAIAADKARKKNK